MIKTEFRNLFSFTATALIALACCVGSPLTASAQQPFDSAPLLQEPAAPVLEPQEEGLPNTPPVQVRPQGDRFPTESLTAPRDRPVQQGQQVRMNSRYAGWEGALANPNASGKRVSDELRANWIMLDPNGRFEGQVTAAQGADIKGMGIYLMHMGRLVKQTKVDDAGRFSFNNVRQGAFSIIGWGNNGLFAFGTNVLAHNPQNTNKVANRIDVMAFQNRSTINTDWIRYYASQVGFRVFGRYPTGEGRDDPSKLYGYAGLTNNLPPASPATSISSHPVRRTADGRLVGRVHQFNSIDGRPVDVRSTRVMLLEGDSVVASTDTDNYGVFEFEDVPDGTYGLLAAGVDGVGLIAINVTDSSMTSNAAGEFQVDNRNGLIDFTLISTETIGWLNHNANQVAYQRRLMAPRPPSADAGLAYGCNSCGNQAGGCSACQQDYLKSICRSRGLTFEQWQANGCQCQRSGFGDGNFFREAGVQLRRQIDKMDRFYDNVFYPNSGNSGITGGSAGYGGTPYQGAPGYQGAPMYQAPPVYQSAPQFQGMTPTYSNPLPDPVAPRMPQVIGN